MRKTGKTLLVAGAALCLLTLFAFVVSNGARDEFEVIDTTPYLVWAAAGAVALVVGAVFFAAGEVIRVLSPPEPARERGGASRSHYE